MHWIMLRGFYPKDRANPVEILYDTLEQETDMWTHLAYGMCREQDTCTVLYGGKDRVRIYNDRLEVMFVKQLKDYAGPKPDFIFARGGFDEYNGFVKRYPCALHCYYGAGRRFIPDGGKWDMVFVDDAHQRERLLHKLPYQNVQLLWKPAAPHFRVLSGIKKEYDVCYVVIHPEDKRKRCEWVYDTCPKDMKILQLGNGPGKHPENITHMLLPREDMPLAMNSCRVGIVPYTKDDSGPRVVPEMNACGLGVVVSEELCLWDERYCVHRASDNDFWDVVKNCVSYRKPIEWNHTAAEAGEHIRNTLTSLWGD